MECYRQAARRLFEDKEFLRRNERFATACHLYGLAAECALKACMKSLPGSSRQLPYKHLPDIANDARRWLKSRQYKGLLLLVGKLDYMQGWDVQNRYWATDSLTEVDCNRFREHAWRTLSAALPGAT